VLHNLSQNLRNGKLRAPVYKQLSTNCTGRYLELQRSIQTRQWIGNDAIIQSAARSHQNQTQSRFSDHFFRQTWVNWLPPMIVKLRFCKNTTQCLIQLHFRCHIPFNILLSSSALFNTSSLWHNWDGINLAFSQRWDVRVLRSSLSWAGNETTDHISSVTCHYLSKLYCLVLESEQHVMVVTQHQLTGNILIATAAP